MKIKKKLKEHDLSQLRKLNNSIIKGEIEKKKQQKKRVKRTWSKLAYIIKQFNNEGQNRIK